jgi:flagellin
MSLVLNTNINALTAQTSLTTSGNQLSNALQQLSSGLRVNTAADDAAGYAIAQGMTSQINGLNQASLNANNGVALAQTAGGALQEVTNDLQTMRDLAVESLNASNSSQDRADLNTQFQQLAADINNVAANTQFNGVNLLNGSFQGQTFQVGANVGQTIEVSSISSASTSAIGNFYTTAGTNAVTGASDGANNGDQGTFTIQISSGTGASATTTTVTTGTVSLTGNTGTDQASIAAAINEAVGSNNGVVATVSGGAIDLSSSAGTAQTVSVSFNAGTNVSTGAADAVTTGTALGVSASYTLGAASGTGKTLSNLNVNTVDNANLSLISIDNALQQMATSSAALGAYQNRFQAAISGLNTDSTNLTSAKSGIVDTDYAQQTSALSKAQILQQAGTAMVAQANTIPQNILTLLQKLP